MGIFILIDEYLYIDVNADSCADVEAKLAVRSPPRLAVYSADAGDWKKFVIGRRGRGEGDAVRGSSADFR
jgi:hypothetical protein